MGERTAFFYGTLMAREILYRVCYGSSEVSNDPFKAKLAASLSFKDAILHDYCRHKVEGADYPGIVYKKDHTVRGTYVTGLTEHDIQRLDWFEGSEYTKQQVTVQLLQADAENNLVEGPEVQTDTYVFTAGRELLEKEEWDYEVFRREKIHRWADVSAEYDEVDEAVANGHDPTGGRGIYSEKPDGSSGKDDEELLRSAV